MTVSPRINELNWYRGQTVFDEEMRDFQTALLNREGRTRRLVVGDLLTKPPKVTRIVAPIPTVQLDNIEGMESNREVYFDAPVSVPLNIANRGVTGSTLPTVSGNGRWVGISLKYTQNAYEDRVDVDGNPLQLRRDDAVQALIWGGIEAPVGSAVRPAVSDGLIVAYVLLRYGSALSDADVYPVHVLHAMTSVGARLQLANELAALLARNPVYSGQTGPYPAMDVVTGAAGGRVRITQDGTIAFGLYARQITDYYSPGAGYIWRSDDLDVNSTYMVRAQLDDDYKLQIYVQKGSFPSGSGQTYTYPVGLVGTPGGSSGGGFPSTPRDILLGRVTTGVAGSMPTFVPFSSDPTYYYEAVVNGDYSATPVFQVDVTLTGGSLPAPGCDFDIDLRSSGESFTVAGPTVNHVHGHNEYFKVLYYSPEKVVIEAKGKWCVKDGSDFLKVPASSPHYRPGFVIKIRPRSISQ